MKQNLVGREGEGIQMNMINSTFRKRRPQADPPRLSLRVLIKDVIMLLTSPSGHVPDIHPGRKKVRLSAVPICWWRACRDVHCR